MALKICLVTTGQPSTNPRLVKEADALAEAGYAVHVIGATWADWAQAADRRLLATRAWSCRIIDWRRQTSPGLFWKTRLRHYIARRLVGPGARGPVLDAALSRITPELTRAASATPADLYIAHNIGALPAALAASRRHGAGLGFDAEDFHSGEFHPDDRSRVRAAVLAAEERYLPLCDYVSAASPEIAAAYARRRSVPPTCILNVFPLTQRPAAPAQTSMDGPLRLYWFSQTIGPHRGLETVVSAMGQLGDGAVELHLRGTWQAGFRDVVDSHADRAGVSRLRIISHEPADPDEMARLAAAHDVGLAVETGATPNSDILLSNKIFTYLLAGIAVVATETRGQQAVLPRLGAAARSCRPGDATGLATAIRPWVADRELLRHARALSWDLGGRTFNWDEEKKSFLGLVSAVLERRMPAGHRVSPAPAQALAIE